MKNKREMTLNSALLAAEAITLAMKRSIEETSDPETKIQYRGMALNALDNIYYGLLNDAARKTLRNRQQPGCRMAWMAMVWDKN